MELDRFQVLRSYAESIKTLAKGDKQLARELAYRVIMYGIYWKEPDSDTNPIVVALFTQIKIPIDTGKNISKINSENWKKWWRPIKDWKNSQKANWKRTESETKPNEKQDESEQESEKNQNIKYKKENIKNNLNNNLSVISAEAQEEKKSYWNEEVNKCLTLIKTFNHWVINWSDSNNRKQARNLILKLKKFDSVVKWQYKRDEVLEWILTVISQNEYYRWKIGSPKLIYDNLWTLVQVCWKESDKLKQKQDVSLQVI